MRGNWQDFNWHDVSRGPSAIAELLVASRINPRYLTWLLACLLSGGVLAWLSVWSEVLTCICSSWCYCHSLSLASVKSRLVLLFWYRLTWVVREKGPLNGCVCACYNCVVEKNHLSVIMIDWEFSFMHHCSMPYNILCIISHINIKNCSLSTVLTATDQKPQKSFKRWYYLPSHCLNVNVMLGNITFLAISAVFDPSQLTLWINCSFKYW